MTVGGAPLADLPGTTRDGQRYSERVGLSLTIPPQSGMVRVSVVVRDTMTGYPLGDHPRITKDGQSSSDHQRYCNMQGVSDGTSLA